MVPALCKVSWAFSNVVLVLPRALEWAGTRLPLGKIGNWESERPRDFPTRQCRGGAQNWG